MQDKFLELSVQTYLVGKHTLERGKKFCKDLKDDELGISGIVVAVLLVLMAAILAAIFWEKIKTFVETQWTKIDSEAGKIGGDGASGGGQ